MKKVKAPKNPKNNLEEKREKSSLAKNKIISAILFSILTTVGISLYNSKDSEIKEEARKELSEMGEKQSSKETNETLIKKDWKISLEETCIKNNFPGSIHPGNEHSITIGLAHRENGSEGDNILNSYADEEAFKKLLPMFEEIGKNHKIIFVVEGLYSGDNIIDKSQIGKRNFLLPHSLNSLEGNRSISGVDMRSKKYGNDLNRVMKNILPILNKITIKLSVPKGQEMNSIQEMSAPVQVETPQLSKEETDILFTYGKVYSGANRTFEEDMEKHKKKLINKGYFPIFLVGAQHAPVAKNSFILANQGENGINDVVYGVKKDQYLDGVLKKNPNYKPEITEDFESLLKYLK